MVQEDRSNPFDTYNVAPLTYDEKGMPVADAPFTSKSDTKRHAVVVPPSKVIPVIFLPGIMGSNLKLLKLPEGFKSDWGAIAWRPDDGISFMFRKVRPLEANQRRRLLDPSNTEVDPDGEISPSLLKGFTFESAADGRNAMKIGEQRRQAFIEEMKRRGWGTVSLESYGPLLAYLEKNLNRMYWRGELNDFWSDCIIARQHVTLTGRSNRQVQASDWGIVKGDKPLTSDDVKKAARYWLPVYAVGYNWLKSNADGAEYVVSKINEFMKRYTDEGYECSKVLLVTHSMGGLLGRAVVHPQMGNAADKVLGVMHGVMPTHGAAAAYRRCHAGFEGASYTSMDGVAAKVLGDTGPKVAAVFSNSPGALQLLPNKLYGAGWLRVQDASGKILLSLPQSDPYTEIYQQKDVWWRLMNPAWVDPRSSASAKDRATSWGLFNSNLWMAQDFHDKLGSTHHAHTYLQYGTDDHSHLAYGALAWKNSNGSLATPALSGPVATTVTSLEADDGTVTLTNVLAHAGRITSSAEFSLSDHDEAGDGTVPRRSACALNETVELVAEHRGYDHQSSYKDSRTQELVAYGVVRLIAENMS